MIVNEESSTFMSIHEIHEVKKLFFHIPYFLQVDGESCPFNMLSYSLMVVPDNPCISINSHQLQWTFHLGRELIESRNLHMGPLTNLFQHLLRSFLVYSNVQWCWIPGLIFIADLIPSPWNPKIIPDSDSTKIGIIPKPELSITGAV